MSTGPVGKSSILPLLAAAVGLGMAFAYMQIMSSQGNTPAWWFVALLFIAAALSAYGAIGPRDHRLPSLTLAAFLFIGAGFISILTIGLPILLAAVLAGLGATLGSQGS